MSGRVILVGAGPGDAELLTIKALKALQWAQVVVYDRLVSDDVLALIPATTEKIYVGKERSKHWLRQDRINQLLIDLARDGQRVVRLKGGDPFIFGRGGEELEALAANAIPFEVVPGITAAIGCAAYAGIPLTHRDYAQSVRFITGHNKEDVVHLQWPELLDERQTLVFYMSLLGIEAICQQLIHYGRAPSTPVALIENGTRPQQRVITTDLVGIGAIVADLTSTAPTLTIVGDVVKLHPSLRWFEQPSATGTGNATVLA